MQSRGRQRRGPIHKGKSDPTVTNNDKGGNLFDELNADRLIKPAEQSPTIDLRKKILLKQTMLSLNDNYKLALQIKGDKPEIIKDWVDFYFQNPEKRMNRSPLFRKSDRPRTPVHHPIKAFKQADAFTPQIEKRTTAEKILNFKKERELIDYSPMQQIPNNQISPLLMPQVQGSGAPHML
jgi:hypothetical protein